MHTLDYIGFLIVLGTVLFVVFPAEEVKMDDEDDWNWKESWDNDHAWDFFCEGRVVDGKATFFDNNGEEKIVIVNNNHRKIMFLNDNLETVSSDIATLRVTFPYFWDKFVVYNR